MQNGIIRIGLIGAGANTRLRHIPGFREQSGVEIVAVANRSRESGERIAGEYEIPKVYDNWLQLMEDDSIDAVCIGTWPYMHRNLVLASLEAGKHVLTEARMAMNAQEAHEMLDAARQFPDLVTQIVPGPPDTAGRQYSQGPHRKRIPWRHFGGASAGVRLPRPGRPRRHVHRPGGPSALAPGPGVERLQHHGDGHLVRNYDALTLGRRRKSRP